MCANILLIGLDTALAAELSRALTGLHHTVASVPLLAATACLNAIDRSAADLVFCTAEEGAYEPLLAAVRERRREVPVVVVSRLPEVEIWLDAMDAGACDYCTPPFEPRLLRSIVDNALGRARRLAAAS